MNTTSPIGLSTTTGNDQHAELAPAHPVNELITDDDTHGDVFDGRDLISAGGV